jgi:D-alanyl-D-alanine carboxypeptidase (penicillin-binding protein 5/6)
MKHLCRVLLASLFVVTVAWGAKPPAGKTGSGRAAIGVRSADPYLGAIVVDAQSGAVLFEDKADEPGYPASVIKLMVSLLIEERVKAGLMALTDSVQVTPEAAAIGGSQVYLDPKETFPVEELVAALVIHSANDAAAALAIHVAGTRNAFVDQMNKRAAELGMKATRFHSVHGLPPAAGQEPDVSTARDLSMLAREVLLKHPDVTRFSSQQNRPFRNGAFTLRNPNHLLGTYTGCDGLKTGYFKAGGFSIVSTAQRNGRRVIAVVVGCADRKVRDATAMDLLSKGFLAQEKLPVAVVAGEAPAAAVTAPAAAR